jgi:hypothetical protein
MKLMSLTTRFQRRRHISKTARNYILFSICLAIITIGLIVRAITEIRLTNVFMPMKAQYQVACERSIGVKSAPGTLSISGKLLIVEMDGEAYTNTMLNPSLKNVVASDYKEVGTLLCVGPKITKRVGTYTSGTSAYRIQRDISLVDMKTVSVIGGATIYGTNPPSAKPLGGSATGSDPRVSVLAKYVRALPVK